MKLKHAFRALAAATALASGSAMAITLTNSDGPFAGFTGFDWSSVGQGLITGYDTLNTTATGNVDPFQLKFQANATSLIVNGLNVSPTLDPGLNTAYEYTVFATVNETATCFTDGVSTCGLVGLNIVNGTWQIRYDTTTGTFANYSNGTGFTDGILLLSGTFSSGPTVLGGQGASNPGNTSLAATFFGTVLTTNLTYVNPLLTGTTATSTLQFGNTQTGGWIAPAAFDGVAVGGNTNTNFSFQADANQSFAIPEPASLALVGLALGALGFAGRRRKQA